jgi:hypothetical protein
MQTIRIGEKGSLVLPKTLRSVFKPSDEIAWFSEGDTLILKKITLKKISDIALGVKEKPMPLAEISREIHKYRKEKRAR